MPFHPHQPARARRPGTEAEQRAVTTDPSSPMAPILYTPAEAARVLRVRESWLRRKAAARQVPCTFLGKHLRFTAADLAAIAAAAQPAVGRRPCRRAPTVRDRDLPTGADRSVHPPDTDDHIRDGSSAWPG
jgi:excisionase family DNA binding protein